mmetsp:Transcript_17697/g.30037  ORF Transcript_17697/g.30037 Transcript_17697/m.30037 type:complete len:851 (+) Transcript_17697:102-2654(+)
MQVVQVELAQAVDGDKVDRRVDAGNGPGPSLSGNLSANAGRRAVDERDAAKAGGTRKFVFQRRQKMIVRDFIVLCITIALCFWQPVVSLVGENISIIALFTIVFVRRSNDKTSLGEQSQLYLDNIVLPNLGIAAGLVAVLLAVESAMCMLFLSFLYTLISFTLMSYRVNRKLPLTFAIIAAQMMMQTGFTLYHFMGLSADEAFAGIYKYTLQLVYAVTIPGVLCWVCSVVIFPWSAVSVTRDLQCKVLSQTENFLCVLDNLCNPCSQLDLRTGETQDIVELLKTTRQTRIKLRNSMYPLRCEMRWKCNGEGRKWENLFVAARQLPKHLASLANSINSTETISWEFLENPQVVQTVIAVLVRDIQEYCRLSKVAICAGGSYDNTKSRSEKIQRIKHQAQSLDCVVQRELKTSFTDSSSMVSATEYIVMLGRMPKILEQMDIAICNLLEKRFRFSLLDWCMTLPFDCFELFPSPLSLAPGSTTFARNTKQRIYRKLRKDVYEVFASDEFMTGLKTAVATVLFLLPGYFKSTASVFSSTAMLLGMRSLQSVLRQVHLGACIERFWLRSVGSLLSYIYTIVAWEITRGGKGTGGFSLALLAVPSIVIYIWNKEKHLRKLYVGYSVIKNYVIIASTAYFFPHGQSVYVSGGWVTFWSVIGCIVGLLFCFLPVIVSAKRRIRCLLAKCYQEYVHILEGGYHANFEQPAYIHEQQPLISLSEDALSNLLAIKMASLTRLASFEKSIGEPISWYKNVIIATQEIHLQLWRLNHMCCWSVDTDALGQEKTEYRMLCKLLGPSFFIICSALERDNVCTIFQPVSICPVEGKKLLTNLGRQSSFRKDINALHNKLVIQSEF